MPASPGVDLRPLTPADADIVASWALDPHFCAAADWTADLPMEEYVSFQRRLITDPPDDLIRLGAIYQQDVVGYAVLQGTEPTRREVGFVIGDSRRWGHGLGGQVARAALDYGFRRLDLTEIWAEALAANLASVRILQGVGMTEIEPGEPGIYRAIPSHYRRFTISAPASTG